MTHDPIDHEAQRDVEHHPRLTPDQRREAKRLIRYGLWLAGSLLAGVIITLAMITAIQFGWV